MRFVPPPWDVERAVLRHWSGEFDLAQMSTRDRRALAVFRWLAPAGLLLLASGTVHALQTGMPGIDSAGTVVALLVGGLSLVVSVGGGFRLVGRYETIAKVHAETMAKFEANYVTSAADRADLRERMHEIREQGMTRRELDKEFTKLETQLADLQKLVVQALSESKRSRS